VKGGHEESAMTPILLAVHAEDPKANSLMRRSWRTLRDEAAGAKDLGVRQNYLVAFGSKRHDIKTRVPLPEGIVGKSDNGSMPLINRAQNRYGVVHKSGSSRPYSDTAYGFGLSALRAQAGRVTRAKIRT
jgi:hypothetical protein